MHPIMDLIHIGIGKPSSRHRGWRIRPAICGLHTNLSLVAAANRLGLYVIIINRWAGRSTPVTLLGLDFGQSLGELMLQLKQTK